MSVACLVVQYPTSKSIVGGHGNGDGEGVEAVGNVGVVGDIRSIIWSAMDADSVEVVGGVRDGRGVKIGGWGGEEGSGGRE